MHSFGSGMEQRIVVLSFTTTAEGVRLNTNSQVQERMSQISMVQITTHEKNVLKKNCLRDGLHDLTSTVFPQKIYGSRSQ